MEAHSDNHAVIDPHVPADPQLDETSAEYVGRWNRLVSKTNWEKGRVIVAWRKALAAAGAPAGAGSDEVWSRRVGGVSAQHVGRLRRAYERFGRVQRKYPGLYWSHFQAALDWPDAEMWLEGAVQNGWSISQMRHQRWEALGAPEGLKPRDEDIVVSEFDEDAVSPAQPALPAAVSTRVGMVHSPSGVGPLEAVEAEGPAAFSGAAPMESTVAPPRRPFENLPALPPDLAEAFESFKLAILHHKVGLWREISLGDVLAVLDALKDLAAAPAE